MCKGIKAGALVRGETHHFWRQVRAVVTLQTLVVGHATRSRQKLSTGGAGACLVFGPHPPVSLCLLRVAHDDVLKSTNNTKRGILFQTQTAAETLQDTEGGTKMAHALLPNES